MPPRTQAAKLICTSCRTASTRHFSTTIQQRKSNNPYQPREDYTDMTAAAPEFVPTSQPELDAILSQYREQLFIPTSLSKSHQRLIYRPSKQHHLTNDPGVTVNISEEEEIRLRPMKLKDRPDNRTSMSKIAALFGETDDLNTWRNLYPFLEGMKQARRPFGSVWLAKVTRKANLQGRYQTVVECAEQASTTDVRLSDPFFTRELLLGCHERAVAAGFKGKEYKKALTMAQHLVFLMEKPEHCLRKSFPPGHFDMRRSLFVNSVLLELHAGGRARAEDAASSAAAAAQDEEITKWVSRVVALTKGPDSHTADLSMPEFLRERQKVPQSQYGAMADKIENLVPLYSGLEFAIKAVRSSERGLFDKTRKQVEREIKFAAERFRQLGGKESAYVLKMLTAVERIRR